MINPRVIVPGIILAYRAAIHLAGINKPIKPHETITVTSTVSVGVDRQGVYLKFRCF